MLTSMVNRMNVRSGSVINMQKAENIGISKTVRCTVSMRNSFFNLSMSNFFNFLFLI